MRAMKRAIARAEYESTMREMPTANLIRRLQFRGKRIPPLPKHPFFLAVDRLMKRTPAFAPAIAG